MQTNINGQIYQVKQDMSLLDFLRDELRLTGTKNGCAEGACGTCTVIIDGRAVKACTRLLSQLEGKQILTIEGLDDKEKAVYTYAFSKLGAVQCGFCTPGMVMAAKALLDADPEPSREQAAYAIRGNICRCTGYIKIIDAILLSAKILREGGDLPKEDVSCQIGQPFPRVDGEEKVTGKAKYVDDFVVDGMLYGRAVRPPAPRCKVLSIDKAKALSIDGVVAVFTAEDIPGKRYIGHMDYDWPVFIAVGEETRYIGDAIALIVAKSKEVLNKVYDLVDIQYEILRPVTDLYEAQKDTAPQIHSQGIEQRSGKIYIPKNNIYAKENIEWGDIDHAFLNAAHIVEHEFQTPQTDHAFLEPECAVAIPCGDGSIELITGGQGVYNELKEVCRVLGVEPEDKKVKIHSAVVGGGFGGKCDLVVQHHVALAAYLLQIPVKVLFSRKESMQVHPKRHAMDIKVKVSCDENGMLMGLQANVWMDSGAYASLAKIILQRACTFIAGPYKLLAVAIDGSAVITNNPPGGAFRGFGVTQVAFAMECCLNELAKKAGISPWEIRYRNGVRPGDMMVNGQIADQGTAYIETLDACKAYYEKNSGKDGQYVGIASAIKNAGTGSGAVDMSRANLAIIDGRVIIQSSAADMGQGLQTLLIQITADTTGVPVHLIDILLPDTISTPDSGLTSASRQTVFTGEAVRKAAKKLSDSLKNNTLDQLEGMIFNGEFQQEIDEAARHSKLPHHISISFATQVVTLNREGRVLSTIQAVDVGKSLNPVMLKGQFEGGTATSMGFALTEDFPKKNGIPTARFATLGLLRSTDMPEIECRIIEKRESGASYGAKGIGEIAAITFAPAVQGAYYNLDGRFRCSLPMKNTFYHKK